MSKAEELLNSLAEAYAAESNSTSDSHIVIGVDRFITVPEELKRIAVQYDHNMRTVTFDCPRYYDGRDMSKMTVYINIRGPKGAPHSYIADNLRVDTSNPTAMHFDWTIRRPVTDVKGYLAFLVCIRKADSEGNEENHWNTELNTDLYISEGMEYEELEEYPYSDIVTQLLQRMGTVEAIATPEAMQGYTNTWLEENRDTVLADIQAKGDEVLANIPEEYSETYSHANEGARTKADAIIRTVDGEVISVSDSSDDYVRGLRVFGKTEQVITTGAQLADFTGGNCASGVTKTFKNDTLIVTGDGSLTYQSWSVDITDVIKNRPGQTLYFDYEVFAAHCTPDGTVVQLNIAKSDDTKEYIGLYHASGTRRAYDIPSDTSVISTISLAVYTSNSSTSIANTITIVKPMLQIDTDKLDYEVYSGGVASPSPNYHQELVSVDGMNAMIAGKNLVDITTGGTATGVTETVTNGLVSFSGTAEGNGGRVLWKRSNDIILYPGTYTLKMNVPSGIGPTPCLSRTDNFALISNGSPATFTIYETTTVFLGFNYILGREYTAQNVSVQLEAGDTATEYEPYVSAQPFPITQSLRGIPVSSGGNYTDANGRQWICDEVDLERGVYVQRVAHYVFDGSDDEEWTGIYTHGETGTPYARIFVARGNIQYTTPLLCNYAKRGTWGRDDICFLNNYYEFMIGSVNFGDVLSTLDTFKSYIAANPIELVYVLETPVETPIAAEELETFRVLRTNYPNTTVLNDSSVKMELKYNADTQLYIDNKIAEVIAALTNS